MRYLPSEKPRKLAIFVAWIEQIMDRLMAARVFVEVLERGSQTAAAEALGDLLVGARAAGQDAVVDLADTDVGVYGARRQAALSASASAGR